MLNEFKALISTSDTIIVFRHLDGDGDALGSQWAMYYYLKVKYPDKEVYAVGDDTDGYRDQFEKPHDIADEKFKDALAVVVDTANIDRISDKRVKLCKTIVKIAHHLDVDAYGDLEFVFPKVSSAAEIVANILRVFEHDQPLSEKVAKCLYTGIISDTQMFSIAGVNEKTFKTVAYLSESNIDVGKICRSLNAIDLDLYKFRIAISNQIIFDDSGLAYLIISNKTLATYNVSHSMAKRNTDLMKNIKGIDIWVLFIEDKEKPNTYSASLRSNEIVINDTDQAFGGGGHNFASGIKGLDEEKFKELIKELKTKL